MRACDAPSNVAKSHNACVANNLMVCMKMKRRLFTNEETSLRFFGETSLFLCTPRGMNAPMKY